MVERPQAQNELQVLVGIYVRAMQVALDIDFTIFPLAEALHTLTGERRSYDPDLEALAAIYGGRENVFALLDQVLTYEAQTRTGLFSGAAAALRRLAGQGIDFHVMTVRNPGYREATERFLVEQGVPFVSLDCDNLMDKTALCLQRGVSVLVDDSPPTLRRAHAAGLTAISLRHDHNASVLDELGIAHADSWEDLEAHVLAAATGLARALVV